MDFIDQLKQFSKRVDTLKDSIQTEEATKTAIIMPCRFSLCLATMFLIRKNSFQSTLRM